MSSTRKTVSFLSLFMIAAMALVFSAPAQAGKVTVYVKNCGDKNRYVEIYDGKDGVLATPRHTKLVKKKQWESMSCDGEGKKRCKVSVKGSGGAKHVKRGEWFIFFKGKDFGVYSEEKKCEKLEE